MTCLGRKVKIWGSGVSFFAALGKDRAVISGNIAPRRRRWCRKVEAGVAGRGCGDVGFAIDVIQGCVGGGH